MRNIITIILIAFSLNGFCQNFYYGNQGSLSAEIDTATYINLRFDNSGSMGSTQPKLDSMVNYYLKDSLLRYYNNDINIYNRKVSVSDVDFEKTFSSDFLNNNIEVLRENTHNKIVTIVYQDEANPIYYDQPFVNTATLKDSFSVNISDLRDSVSQYDGTLRYTGIIFQVEETYSLDGFKKFIQAVENGDGNYSGTSGLSDKSKQFAYYYDITDGGTAIYYTNLLMTALRDLGFDL